MISVSAFYALLAVMYLLIAALGGVFLMLTLLYLEVLRLRRTIQRRLPILNPDDEHEPQP